MEQLGTSTMLLLVLTFIYLVLRLRPRIGSKANRPLLLPGPTPWPVVGSLPEMMLSKPAFQWIHRVMEEKGTDIACVLLGPVHVVSIACPRITREVLMKQDRNFASRPLTFASPTFSRGYKNAVLSPFGDQWRKMRRVLTSEIIYPSCHRWLHDRRTDKADNLIRYH